MIRRLRKIQVLNQRTSNLLKCGESKQQTLLSKPQKRRKPRNPYKLTALLAIAALVFSMMPANLGSQTATQSAYASTTIDPSLSAGGFHSLALNEDGDLYAWGWNKYAQLGKDPLVTGKQSIPEKAVSSVGKVKAISAGRYHSLALNENGDLYAWGRNNNYELGKDLSPITETHIPQKVESSVVGKVEAASAGGFHSLALNEDGDVYAWGYSFFGQLGKDLSPITKTADPQKVESPTMGKVKAISAGGYHTLALNENGDVYAWGRNQLGQLAKDKSTTKFYTPQKVESPTMGKVKAISAGGYHTLALNENGDVYAWGYNLHGQLGTSNSVTGNSTSLPYKINSSVVGKVKAISAGGNHTLVLNENGDLYTCGYNTYGQLGDGTTNPAVSIKKIEIVDGSEILKVVAISAGAYHSLAMAEDGSLWGWGRNTDTALVDAGQVCGTQNFYTTPQKLSLKFDPIPAALLPAPANLTAMPNSTSIDLSWDEVTDAEGYNVYRKEGAASYAKQNTTLVTDTAYNDTTPVNGVTYTYYVVAVDTGSNEGSQSSEVTSALSDVLSETVPNFADVPGDAWYKDALNALYGNNIISGYPDNTFRPNNRVSREEFTKMISVAMSWSSTSTATLFSDVSLANWSYPYIAAVGAHSAIEGYPDGTFRPKGNITRAEVATILAKVKSLSPVGASFSDTMGHWANGQIGACFNQGYLQGYAGNIFKPDNPATRAEAVMMIAALIGG